MPFAPFLSSVRRARRHGRLASAALLFSAMAVLELASGGRQDFREGRESFAALFADDAEPARLPAGDSDGDGLSDEREVELARRYAPIVIIDREDAALPASVSWVLSRTNFMEGAANVRITKRAFDADTRKGSSRPEDWVTYVDVYPRAHGGIQIEYWFYYPYNDGPLFFQHESDWEHATVRLDAEGTPMGAYLARHEDNDPGPFFEWSRLRKEGDHAVLLSARGTHATYADRKDLAWFEYAGTCEDLGSCSDRVWRTWEGGGLFRLDAVTEGAVSTAALRFPGRWGQTGVLPGTSAPRGPMFQAGHCAGGFDSCRRMGSETASLAEARSGR